MKNIVIVGASGHARVIIDLVEKEGKYRIVGLIDSNLDIGGKVLGYTIIGEEDDLPKLLLEHALEGVIIAVGDNSVRSKVASKIKDNNPDVVFVSVVHPMASVAKGVSIGEGTVVMSGCSVGPCSSIGKFCILNTNCSLDHDSSLGEFSSLAPNSATGGGCHIAQYTSIGIGAILVNGVHIGEHTAIGAGAVVLKNVEDFSIAYGAPAKTIRSRKIGEKYF